jgi:hypothetical protein
MREYSVQDIAAMPTITGVDALGAIIALNHKSLCAVTVAEAVGKAPPSATELLALPENCEKWWRALLHIRANLSAWMAYRRIQEGARLDQDSTEYRRNLETRKAVASRVGAARSRVWAVRADIERRRRAAVPKSPQQSPALLAVIAAHTTEYERILRRVCDEVGTSYGVLTPPPGALSDVAWATRAHLINAPVTDTTSRLLQLTDQWFMDLVADDVRKAGGLEKGLRNPLLLDRWSAALGALLDETFERLNLPAASKEGIPQQAWYRLSLDPQEATTAVKRMRFIEAIHERKTELEWLLRLVALEISCNWEAVAGQVRARAGRALVARYPEEHSIHAGLASE